MGERAAAAPRCAALVGPYLSGKTTLLESLLFATGAIIPVLPFLIGAGAGAIVASAVMSGVALFALGAAITLLTGRHPLFAGLRQVGFGMAAAAITFGIGTLLGTAIG